MDALSLTGAAMLNDVERMRVISNNLANLTTVGFKRELSVARPFADLVTGMADSTGTVSRTSAPSVVSYTDQGSGVLKYTAGPLDVALEGSGLLVVDTPWGEGLTRQGSLQLDEQGRLVTQSGHVVQGEGGEIRLSSPEPRIDAEGYVWDGDNKVARLRIVEVIDARTLERIGSGMFAATESTEYVEPVSTRVRQGYVEAANVTSMNEMVHMIETMRHFESSQRLLRGYDDMMDRAINLLGEL